MEGGNQWNRVRGAAGQRLDERISCFAGSLQRPSLFPTKLSGWRNGGVVAERGRVVVEFQETSRAKASRNPAGGPPGRLLKSTGSWLQRLKRQKLLTKRQPGRGGPTGGAHSSQFDVRRL